MLNSSIKNLIHELIQRDQLVNYVFESKGGCISKPPVGADSYKVNPQDPANWVGVEEAIAISNSWHWCWATFIEGRSTCEEHSAALVCMHCIPMRKEIIRKHVLQTGVAGTRTLMRDLI